MAAQVGEATPLLIGPRPSGHGSQQHHDIGSSLQQLKGGDDDDAAPPLEELLLHRSRSINSEELDEERGAGRPPSKPAVLQRSLLRAVTWPARRALTWFRGRTARRSGTKKRLQSLDIMRGIDMFFMILVDNQGDFAHVIKPLDESKWDGMRLSDCVFPTFVFIVGMAVALAMRRAKLRSLRLWYRIMKRTFLLFAIGVGLNFLASNCNIHHFVIMGVLQRIALCYFSVVLLFLLLPNWLRISVMGAAVSVFCIIFYRLPTSDDCGYGTVSPECNAGAFIDRKVFGSYMIHPNEPEGLLTTVPAVLTTFVGLQLGILVGRASRRPSVKGVKGFVDARAAYDVALLPRIAALGLGVFSLGFLLTVWVPLNKKVWSLSFALCTAGIATGVFLLLFIFADLVIFQGIRLDLPPPKPQPVALFERNPPLSFQQRQKPTRRSARANVCRATHVAWRWVRRLCGWVLQPMLWLGTNPILVFVGMVLLEIVLLDTIHLQYNGKRQSLWHVIFLVLFDSWIPVKWISSLVVSLCHAALWIAVAGTCYRLGYFLKL